MVVKTKHVCYKGVVVVAGSLDVVKFKHQPPPNWRAPAVPAPCEEANSCHVPFGLAPEKVLMKVAAPCDAAN